MYTIQDMCIRIKEDAVLISMQWLYKFCTFVLFYYLSPYLVPFPESMYM